MLVGSDWTTEEVLSAFDSYLQRARGLSVDTRACYARFVRWFVEERFHGGPLEVAELGARDVSSFLGVVAGRYGPRSLELVATSLRSFFRFLRSEGLAAEGLDATVPMVPRRRDGLVRHLRPAAFEQLLASLGTSSARELRDRAVILCMARLGLRASEVCRLQLDDIDWHGGTLRVRSRKTGHGARLPLTAEVGAALADYLEHGRPSTSAREVFVVLRLRPGAPISRSIVKNGVDEALRRAGIEAPMRGANLLRHSLATELLARGAGLVDIAGLFGHSSLASTKNLGRRRCRGPAPGGTAVARGDVMTSTRPIAELVDEYIALRRSLGYRSVTRERSLRAFARYLSGHDGPVPLESTLGWATWTSSTDPHNPARRVASVRPFLRHLHALDGGTDVPAPGLLGPTGYRKPPHIYSDGELADLLAAARRLSPVGGLRPLCYYTELRVAGVHRLAGQ